MSATRPHRKLVKHYHEPGDVHELTFSCYQRRPLLTNDSWRRQLVRSIDAAHEALAEAVAPRRVATARLKAVNARLSEEKKNARKSK